MGYALHKIPGGRKTFIEYARLAAASSEAVAIFIECFDDLSQREKESIPLDTICLETASITPGELLAEVVKTAFEFGRDVSSLLASTCLPEVVNASINNAKRKDGFKDRQMLMQHGGIAPVPKTATLIRINNQLLANAHAQGGNGGSSTSAGMPTFEENTMDLAKIVRSTDDGEKREESK